MELMNRLFESESPYLRKAAHQPVKWQIYSDQVFRLAKELDRPILIDIGAVWCHWCHVMDNESYSDPAVAELINENFVPVKVDRDQMPDVDSRYQAAIGALTGAGGWPLTGFLTSEGKVFFGGTYFPKNDQNGRQGLLELLPQIAEVYARRKSDVFRSAEEIFHQLKEYDRRSIRPGKLGEGIIHQIVDDAKAKFDKDFGGFGMAPKFFESTVLHLLAEEALRQSDPVLEGIVELTLDGIAHGGVYDQLGGGFHRYSVDRYWHVPHFEKMLSDNALMLKACLLGFHLLHKESYANVARETADWMIGTMKSPDGPFYSHQDADVTEDDDGTYWTWTKKELENIFTKDEKEILESFFGIREVPNDTHEYPERNVLRIAVAEKEIARDFDKSEDEVIEVIRSAKKKLLASRNRRISPFIDGTIFADRNGLAISALVEASISLKSRRYIQAAESAADFILKNMVDEGGKVAHAFSGGAVQYQGLLDDNVYFGMALLDLFDVTRNDMYIDAAEKIGRVLLDEFSERFPSGQDLEAGGFFDRPWNDGAEGLLADGKKPIDDTPTPSGNSGAAILFDRLFISTENRKYYETADRTLRAFAGSAAKKGTYASNFGRAVRLHLDLSKNIA